MKPCAREKCKKQFEPNKPKQIFCSTKCRVYDKREERAKSFKALRGRPPKAIEKPIVDIKTQKEENHQKIPKTSNQEQIAALEAEWQAIPNKGSGVGRQLAKFLESKIQKLKSNN